MKEMVKLWGILSITSCFLGLVSPAMAKEDGILKVWTVDPLVKVFRDSEPVTTGQALAEVARGEHATLQIVIRCTKPIQELHAKIGPLALESNARQVLESTSVRFVGYVPVDRPIPRPPKTIERVKGSHEQNWISAIKQDTKAVADFSYSGPLTEFALLGNVAKRFPGKVLKWDGPNMKVTNLPEANEWVKRPYRQGWPVPVG